MEIGELLEGLPVHDEPLNSARIEDTVQRGRPEDRTEPIFPSTWSVS